MNEKNNFHELAGRVQQEVGHAVSEINPNDVEEFLGKLLKANRIFIAGKGRTGLQMQSFAMRLMHLGLQVHVIGSVTTPGIVSGDVLVIGTASGRTPALVMYAEAAKDLGVEIISITANDQNLVSKLSAITVVIPAPSHKNSSEIQTISSVQPMGGLFESTLGLLLNIMVIQLMDRMNISEAAMIARHANIE